MDQSNRIAKDISARKTPTKMHSAMEMQAVRASHEAYLKSVIRGYEEQAATAAAEHEQEIKDLKAAMTQDKAQVARDKEVAVTEAVRRALGGSSTQIAQLQEENQRLQGELKESRKNHENLRNAANERIRGKNTTIDTLKSQHDAEIANLKEQLKVGPNSWFEIHFKCKGRRDRTYIRRPHAELRGAVEDLCHDIGLGRDRLRFQLKDRVIKDPDDFWKTVEELGIEQGSTVTYEKK